MPRDFRQITGAQPHAGPLRGFTGLGVKIQGHLKIVEYANRASYDAGEPSRTLLNRRNAVHKENAVNLVVNALTGRANSAVTYMVFGNGGTTLDNTGTISFNAPHVSGAGQDLYSPVLFQMVDDNMGALPGNQMAVRHIHNTLFTDMDIRCLIDANTPFGQISSDEFQPLTLKHTTASGSPQPTTPFVFDEIGLKLRDGTLLTHVVFVPILKTASSLIEVVYTLRLAVGAPPANAMNDTFFMTGVEATTQFGIETPVLPFCVGAVRLNDSPYFDHLPSAIADSPVGSLSVWVKSRDIFTMAHDIGPAFLSSAKRTGMEIAGRGYSRRQPTAITRTNPVQITIPNHGLSGSETIEFTHVLGGCSELESTNPDTNTVTIVDANNFTIPVDGTAFAAAYTGPAQLTLRTHAKEPANTMRIAFRDTDDTDTATTEFYWNAADTEQIPLGVWVNLLISWDMSGAAGSKVLQVYINDTAVASTTDPTYRYDPDAGFSVPYTSSPAWMIGQPVIPQTYVRVTQVAREVLRSRV